MQIHFQTAGGAYGTAAMYSFLGYRCTQSCLWLINTALISIIQRQDENIMPSKHFWIQSVSIRDTFIQPPPPFNICDFYPIFCTSWTVSLLCMVDVMLTILLLLFYAISSSIRSCFVAKNTWMWSLTCNEWLRRSVDLYVCRLLFLYFDKRFVCFSLTILPVDIYHKPGMSCTYYILGGLLMLVMWRATIALYNWCIFI